MILLNKDARGAGAARMRCQGVQDHFERVQDARKVHWRGLPLQGPLQTLEPAENRQALGREGTKTRPATADHKPKLILVASLGNAQFDENAPLRAAMPGRDLPEETPTHHVLYRHRLPACAQAQGRHLGRDRAPIGLRPVYSSEINIQAFLATRKRK